MEFVTPKLAASVWIAALLLLWALSKIAASLRECVALLKEFDERLAERFPTKEERADELEFD